VLFHYQYVNHSIETFQTYLNHLVKEVWCKADGDFSVDMLHPDLKAIVLEIFDTEESAPRGRVKTDWLFGPIHDIFELFKPLGDAQKQRVAAWFDNNNDIEAVCGADPTREPATYDDIRGINAELAKLLKEFCTSLFTDVLALGPVRSRIGDINGHWAAFSAVNTKSKCPYCGFTDIMGLHHTDHREAYDHYLPKGVYPFNSVNFHNLATMCHHCNSTYKLVRDTTWQIDPIGRKGDGSRRKAFYSYAAGAPAIAINMTLNAVNGSNLEPEHIDLEIRCLGREEEVQAWKDVFGIEQRYKAKLCGESDGKGWLIQALDEARNYMSPSDYLTEKRRHATMLPFVDANFLKVPFLEACQAANLF